MSEQESKAQVGMVKVVTYLSLDNLALELSRDREVTHEQILQFIFDLDNFVADLDFTIALRDGLTEVIDSELGESD